MSAFDVALTVGVSMVTTLLVTSRHQLRALLPHRRPKPLDPELMAQIMGKTNSVATGTDSTDSRPSGPRPPVQ